MASKHGQQALAAANTVLLPLMRAVHRYNRVYAGRKPYYTMKIQLIQTGDRRIHIAVIDIPGSNPLVVAIYSSTQESRPVSPSQIKRRLKRLFRLVSRLRGKLFTAADIVYIYITRRRLTRNAYRIALSNHVNIALSPQKAAATLARLLEQRFRRLQEKLAGRKVWGIVKALYHSLATLYETLNTPANTGIELIEKWRTIDASTQPR